jgi:hypothetical protein
VHVDEAKFCVDCVILAAGYRSVDGVARCTALVTDHADRGGTGFCHDFTRRKGDLLEIACGLVVAGDAIDGRFDRGRRIDLAGHRAVRSEKIQQAGAGMAGGAILRHGTILVPVNKGFRLAVAMRRGHPAFDD